jgi:hypothetical protein
MERTPFLGQPRLDRRRACERCAQEERHEERRPRLGAHAIEVAEQKKPHERDEDRHDDARRDEPSIERQARCRPQVDDRRTAEGEQPPREPLGVVVAPCRAEAQAQRREGEVARRADPVRLRRDPDEREDRIGARRGERREGRSVGEADEQPLAVVVEVVDR